MSTQVLVKLLRHVDSSWLQLRSDTGLDILRYACRTCDASSIKQLLSVGADLTGVWLGPIDHGPLPIEEAICHKNGKYLNILSQILMLFIPHSQI